MHVIETGSYILYQPAVRAHGHIDHDFFISDFLPFGCKEDLGAAFFRIAGNAGQVRIAEIMQAGKESPVNGILPFNKFCQVLTVMYAFLDSL